MYTTMKLLIRYKRKSAQELLAYCDAYLAKGKLTQAQYDELVAMITPIEE